MATGGRRVVWFRHGPISRQHGDVMLSSSHSKKCHLECNWQLASFPGIHRSLCHSTVITVSNKNYGGCRMRLTGSLTRTLPPYLIHCCYLGNMCLESALPVCERFTVQDSGTRWLRSFMIKRRCFGAGWKYCWGSWFISFRVIKITSFTTVLRTTCLRQCCGSTPNFWTSWEG